jgi:hypothetical protein
MTSTSSIQRRPDPDSRNERLVDARSAELMLAAALAVPSSRGGDTGPGDSRGDRHTGRNRSGGRRNWRIRSVA